MFENFNIQLEKKLDDKEEIEVNNYTRINLINNNLIGII